MRDAHLPFPLAIHSTSVPLCFRLREIRFSSLGSTNNFACDFHGHLHLCRYTTPKWIKQCFAKGEDLFGRNGDQKTTFQDCSAIDADIPAAVRINRWACCGAPQCCAFVFCIFIDANVACAPGNFSRASALLSVPVCIELWIQLRA